MTDFIAFIETPAGKIQLKAALIKLKNSKVPAVDDDLTTSVADFVASVSEIKVRWLAAAFHVRRPCVYLLASLAQPVGAVTVSCGFRWLASASLSATASTVCFALRGGPPAGPNFVVRDSVSDIKLGLCAHVSNCRSRNATDLLGHGQHRAGARPHMCMPTQERHHCSESGTLCAAHATLPPSPPTAGRGPMQGHTCVCRHQRVAITASRARLTQLVPPRPRPAEGQRRTAHVCAAISVSRSWRDLHAPCSSESRDATALPGHGQRRVSAGPHMCVPLSARRHSYGTCTHRAASST